MAVEDVPQRWDDDTSLSYDRNKMVSDDGFFYLLMPRGTFDSKTREPQRRTLSTEPFELLEGRPWI